MSSPSPALLSAQKRLLQRRIMLGVHPSPKVGEKSSDGFDEAFTAHALSWENCEPLPAHLGYESQRVTESLRKIHPFVQHKQKEYLKINTSWTETIHFEKEDKDSSFETPSISSTELVTVSPDLVGEMFKRKQTSILRLYYLFRYLDTEGSGQLNLSRIRKQLTEAGSPYRICGPKRFGQLLQSGMGLFWTMGNGRIWLRSLPKVLGSFGVTRLQFRSVDMSVSSLLNSMSKTNAHFYATIHSGRNSNAPISRATLTELTGIPKTTQIQYEKTAGITKTTNYAIGPHANEEQRENMAWQRGTAVFTVTDYLGLQGTPGAKYIAWQLPNSYRNLYACRSRSRRKRINNKLGLVIHREPGNGFVRDRFYYADGKHAAEAANRRLKQIIYWPNRKTSYGDQLHCVFQPQPQLGDNYS